MPGAKIKLEPGYEMKFAGEDKELRENKAEMSPVMKISLALIALTMVLQFISVVKSVVVMLTVPLGLIGAVLGLWVTKSPLGFMALLAIRVRITHKPILTLTRSMTIAVFSRVYFSWLTAP